MMEEWLESEDYPKDIVTSIKLYNFYLEKMADAPGVRQDDR